MQYLVGGEGSGGQQGTRSIPKTWARSATWLRNGGRQGRRRAAEVAAIRSVDIGAHLGLLLVRRRSEALDIEPAHGATDPIARDNYDIRALADVDAA